MRPRIISIKHIRYEFRRRRE